jgi:hypothetical protein
MSGVADFADAGSDKVDKASDDSGGCDPLTSRLMFGPIVRYESAPSTDYRFRDHTPDAPGPRRRRGNPEKTVIFRIPEIRPRFPAILPE